MISFALQQVSPMQLSAAQIGEFDRQDYLFFPGAFSPRESELLKQAPRDDDTLPELAAGDLQTA